MTPPRNVVVLALSCSSLLIAACGTSPEEPARRGTDRLLRLPSAAVPSAPPAALPTLTGGSTDDLPVVEGLPPPPPPPPQQPELPSDVLFDTGSALLKPEGVTFVQAYAVDLLQSFPTATVRLVGHTDSRGSDAENLDLSLARAQAVLEQFVIAGFPRDRVSAAGAGEGRPLQPDTSAEGNYDESVGQSNRRVEVQVSV